MKLTITLAEAHSLVRQALSLPVDTEVTISRNINPNRTPSVRKRLADLVEEIDGLRWARDEKIPAIKRFREVVSSGLFEAKWAIENWPEVKGWIVKNRRIPVLDTTTDAWAVRHVTMS